MQIYILQNHNEYNRGDIIQVPDNEALTLIERKIARTTGNRDFLVKPEFGTTRAFKKPPARTGRRIKIKVT